MEITLITIAIMVIHNLFLKSEDKPTSAEATVCRVCIVKITIPHIPGDSYYSIDVKADKGSMYSLLLPCGFFEKCPVEVGQRVTIVFDKIWYIVSKGFKFYDYTHYVRLEHQRR